MKNTSCKWRIQESLLFLGVWPTWGSFCHHLRGSQAGHTPWNHTPTNNLRVENTFISSAFESWKKCGTSSMNMSRWGRLFQWNFIAYIWRISFHFFYSWQMTYTVSYKTSALQHVTSPRHLNWAEYPWWMVDNSRWNIFLWRFPGALSLSWNTKSWKVIPRYYCQLFESMDIIQLINICHYSKSVKFLGML